MADYAPPSGAPSHADLAAMCQETYSGADIIAGPDGRDGARVFRQTDGSAVLVFRGTLVDGAVGVRDWINDFRIGHTEMQGVPGKVHEGFASSVNDLWPAVQAALNGVSRLTITGHSKGGALAILAGARLAGLQPPVVTFGAPKVGDLAFVSQYPLRSVVRYEHSTDIVPLVPFIGFYLPGEVRTDRKVPGWKKVQVIGQMVAHKQWTEIEESHSLATGYLPWIGKTA